MLQRCSGSVVMDWHDRITGDPQVLGGKPVIRGTRLAVEYLLDLLSGGWTVEDILQNWPGLTSEDICAVMAYARDAVHADRLDSARAGR
jgi:uncharacterized protein (DUF433 family)